jgi:hypothetical protein
LTGLAPCGAVALAAGALELASTRAEAPSKTQAQPMAVLPAARTSADLGRFALNALLVPPLDGAWPPRWTDAAVAYRCGPGMRVTIDGLPLQPNSPMPADAFNVRWQVER